MNHEDKEKVVKLLKSLLPIDFKLFENNSDNPNAPHRKGNVKLNGIEEDFADIAGWEREARNGTRYLSVRISEPYPRKGDRENSDPTRRKLPTLSEEELREEYKQSKIIQDDDIPF